MKRIEPLNEPSHEAMLIHLLITNRSPAGWMRPAADLLAGPCRSDLTVLAIHEATPVVLLITSVSLAI